MDSVSPREQALHAAYRKRVIGSIYYAAEPSKMLCSACNSTWVAEIEGERHAPGCLAAPAAQQPLPALERAAAMSREAAKPYDHVFAAQQPVADAPQDIPPLRKEYLRGVAEGAGWAIGSRDGVADGRVDALPELKRLLGHAETWLAAQQIDADSPLADAGLELAIHAARAYLKEHDEHSR